MIVCLNTDFKNMVAAYCYSLDQKRYVNSMKKYWTLRYTLINILYFAAFCTLHGYASVFLLSKGFTNTEVGMALALANILCVLCQPIIAGIVDRSESVTNRRVVIAANIIMLLGTAALLFTGNSKGAIFIIYVLIYMIQFSFQPMMIAMNFEYQSKGATINFGLARGMGSAGFAVTSAFLGRAIAQSGTMIILYVTMAVVLAMIIVAYLFKEPDGETVVDKEACEKAEEAKGDEPAAGPSDFLTFVRKYPVFMLFVLATACCFFSHNMLNDFLIQIIRELGGGETELGYASFLQAILELPVMALMGILLKKIKTRTLLIFSAVAFLAKVTIMYMASGLGGMFLSQAFQMFAYAVFIPVSAYYAEEVMEGNDKVKGQAFINIAITLGGVFSNLVSGRILDKFGVSAMLICGMAVTAVGVIIMIAAMRKKPVKIC